MIKIEQTNQSPQKELNISLNNGNDNTTVSINSDLCQVSGNKRRVTFSNQVSSCPSPGNLYFIIFYIFNLKYLDDATYPAASIAPLKSEVFFVSNKLRKRKFIYIYIYIAVWLLKIIFAYIV